MKAVILGAGFIAEFHARGYGSQLCAVCDTDASKAQELAQKYGCRWYTDAQNMLDAEKPDVVSVCLPTWLHRPYAVMALESGAHVLCEKPLALTMDDCLAMQQAAKRCARQLVTAQVLRWWPEYACIAEQVKRLGTPQYISTRRLQHPSRISWHVEPKLGGGALYDLFIHDVDFVCSLMQEPPIVLAASGNRGPQGSFRRIDALLQFSGCCAHVEASSQMPAGYPFTAAFRAEYPDACIEYSFRTAVNINLEKPAQTEFLLYENGGPRAMPVCESAQETAFRDEIAAFLHGVETGLPSLPLEETIAVMQTVDTIHRLIC